MRCDLQGHQRQVAVSPDSIWWSNTGIILVNFVDLHGAKFSHAKQAMNLPNKGPKGWEGLSLPSNNAGLGGSGHTKKEC